MAGDVEGFEKVDGGGVERGAEDDEAAGAGALEDGGVPFPGGEGELVEVVEGLAAPEALGVVDEKIAVADVEGYGVGGIGLQLEGVGAGIGGGVDEAEGLVEALAVVAGHFGDDEGGAAGADFGGADADGIHGRFSRMALAARSAP